jgi:hypothetical protein
MQTSHWIPGSQDRTSSVHHFAPFDNIFRKMSPAMRTSRHLRPFLHPFNLGDQWTLIPFFLLRQQVSWEAKTLLIFP